MQAALLRAPGSLEIVSMDDPRPSAGDVVVRVRAALTCGTDLKTFLRGHPKWKMPMRFGHEFSGVVEAVGAGVDHVRVGDAVMAAPTAPCGHCRWCTHRQENLCESLMPEMVHGAYGELLRLPARVVEQNLFPKPDDVSFAEAAFLEPLACVLHGLEGSSLSPGDRAVVIGAGAIGLLHVAVLRARGIEEVWVVSRNAARAGVAQVLGATRVIGTGADEAVDEVRAHSDGGVDLVVECAGLAKVWEAAPRMARRGGEAILFGGCPSGTDVTFSAAMLHYDEVRIRSPFHFTPRDVRRSYELISAGSLDLKPVLSDSRPLAALESALRDMEAGVGIKFVVEP